MAVALVSSSSSANDPAAIASDRDAGLGHITIAPSVTINVGTGQFQATMGVGTSGGNLTIGTVFA